MLNPTEVMELLFQRLEQVEERTIDLDCRKDSLLGKVEHLVEAGNKREDKQLQEDQRQRRLKTNSSLEFTS